MLMMNVLMHLFCIFSPRLTELFVLREQTVTKINELVEKVDSISVYTVVIHQ